MKILYRMTASGSNTLFQVIWMDERFRGHGTTMILPGTPEIRIRSRNSPAIEVHEDIVLIHLLGHSSGNDHRICWDSGTLGYDVEQVVQAAFVEWAETFDWDSSTREPSDFLRLYSNPSYRGPTSNGEIDVNNYTHPDFLKDTLFEYKICRIDTPHLKMQVLYDHSFYSISVFHITEQVRYGDHPDSLLQCGTVGISSISTTGTLNLPGHLEDIYSYGGFTRLYGQDIETSLRNIELYIKENFTTTPVFTGINEDPIDLEKFLILRSA